MGNENQNNPYFLFAFILLIVLRILVKILNLGPTYDKIIYIISTIVVVVYLAIRTRNQSKKVKNLLLFVMFSICIIAFALYFAIINGANIDGNIIIFIFGVPIVIVLLAIVYKTFNQIIQYYRYK